MVVDRQAIIDSVLRMGQTPSYGILPSGIQGGIYDDTFIKPHRVTSGLVSRCHSESKRQKHY